MSNNPPRPDPYHPTTAGRRRGDRKLRTWDATAMAVGGMIGGGIFSVLGVAIALAGHLAFGCFLIGGAIAAVTAWSYAGVTSRSGRSGGPFNHLRDAGHPQLGGILLWLLVFGYMVAMAVYSFTFGRYAANAFGAPSGIARLLSIAVIVMFLAINMRGVRLSSITEDLIVFAKLVILSAIAVVGLAQFTPDRLTPLDNGGVSGALLGAATVFFAYEGFELISYDRDDMDRPESTLPRALMLSVVIVAAVYIAVTLGSQMLVSDGAIVARKEVAFAAVGEAAFGGIGRWAAIIGAVLATGSAINATLFSTARLIRDASRTGDLPAALGRQSAGQPILAMILISVIGGAMAMLSGITAVITFGSASFLAVYTLVNYLQATMAARAVNRALAWVGVAACVAALAALFYELARDDPGALAILLAIASGLAATRALFLRRRRVHP